MFPLVTSNTHTHTQNVTRFPGPSAVDKPHNEDFLSESSHLPTRSKDRTVKKGTWPCFSLCSYIRFSGHMHFLSRDFSPRSQEGDCCMQNSGFLPPEQLILTFFKMSSRLTSCKKHLKACCTITLQNPHPGSPLKWNSSIYPNPFPSTLMCTPPQPLKPCLGLYPTEYPPSPPSCWAHICNWQVST